MISNNKPTTGCLYTVALMFSNNLCRKEKCSLDDWVGLSVKCTLHLNECLKLVLFSKHNHFLAV